MVVFNTAVDDAYNYSLARVGRLKTCSVQDLVCFSRSTGLVHEQTFVPESDNTLHSG